MKKKLALLLAALLLFAPPPAAKPILPTIPNKKFRQNLTCRNAAFPTLSPMHGRNGKYKPHPPRPMSR